MNNIIEKIHKSNLFTIMNGIHIQDKETIFQYNINKKEQKAMDDLVSQSQIIYSSDLNKYYSQYSTLKIQDKNQNIINRLKLKQKNLAIDCGCGKGEYLNVLSEKFEIVIAIDLSFEAILYAKNNNKDLKNIIYINGSMLDFYKIFNEPIADFCLSAEVIEHVPSPNKYLDNIYSLLRKDGQLLISTPCQNLYFYPMQFSSMILTKPLTLYKLLNPLKYWEFALDWHPAMSKKDFLNLLENHNFNIKHYSNFVPYYFDKLPIFFYIAQLLPKKYSYSFYKVFLENYNDIVEKIEFGIRQHRLVEK